MSDKFESRTPAPKRKQISSKTPSTGSKLQVEFTPNKRSKPEVPHKHLEFEEFPRNTPRFDPRKKITDSQSSEEGFSNLDKSELLSIVSHYDEIIRSYEEYYEADLTEEFLEFAKTQELCRLEWLNSVNECRRLQSELEKANHEIGDFAAKLQNARKLLDQEKKIRRRVEDERNCLEQQMLLARDLLFSEKCNRIPDDTKEKLAFLNNTTIRSRASIDKNRLSNGGRLNTISEVNSQELNSTGSLLSDFSYSRSEDNLDTSVVLKNLQEQKLFKSLEWKTLDIQSPKRRRSSTHKVEINPSDVVVATTTLSVSKDGGVVATSIIDAVPQESEPELAEEVVENLKPVSPRTDIVEKLWLREKCSPAAPTSTATNITRQHHFVSKTVLCPDTCGACKSRVRFGKIVFKCKDCRSICHEDCRNILPLPCIPFMNTPTQKGRTGTISDYVPSVPPLVPSIIVHCINEVELRGLNEVGVYRVPGSEKDVKTLKEKFLRSKSTPSLNDVDVHVICGVIKDFLRSLKEPLVTMNLRKEFIHAVESKHIKDVAPALYQALSQLPQANIDTLAYIMLHLNRVSESRECKMPAGNLAKIFAPTIIGYSSEDIEPQALLTETAQQFMVMDHLMKIPTDFWASKVNVDSNRITPKQKILIQTPSTESLPRTNFFTPHGSKTLLSSRKRKKFFATPPSKK